MGGRLRLLTFNIWFVGKWRAMYVVLSRACRWGGGLSLRDTIRAMQSSEADIIGVQEPRTRKEAGFVDVLPEVANKSVLMLWC